MTANVGTLHLQSTQNVLVNIYKVEDGDSIHGYDFQFNDGDTSLLTHGGLPTGYRLSFLDADVGLFVTDSVADRLPESAIHALAARAVRLLLHQRALLSDGQRCAWTSRRGRLHWVPVELGIGRPRAIVRPTGRFGIAGDRGLGAMEAGGPDCLTSRCATAAVSIQTGFISRDGMAGKLHRIPAGHEEMRR